MSTAALPQTATPEELREPRPAPSHCLIDSSTLLQVIESVADAILVLDPKRIVSYANAAAATMLGVPRSELVGQSWGVRRWHTTLLDGRPVPPEQHTDKSALERGEVTHGMERRITRPDGSQVMVRGSTVPLLSQEGKVTGIILSYTDITNHVRAEERLRHAQKMEAVGKLAGGIAHDFNNLLTAIIGNLAVVRGDLSPVHPSHELLAECEKAGWQAADLTKRLLNFARLKPTQMSSFLLSRAADDTLAILRPSLPEGTSVRVRHQHDLWPVLADAGQMLQVALNLCTNARDALGVDGQLGVETTNVHFAGPVPAGPLQMAPGDYVRLSVTDNGSGMSAEVRERMFEPFFSTKPMGKGTGLGLAVVFGIVQSHGGWIECESEAGKGTRMHVFLPRERAAAAAGQSD